MIKTEKLKELIKNSEYKTQKNFSQALGMSYQGFNMILLVGKTSLLRAKQISEALGVSTEDILTTHYYNNHSNELNQKNDGISKRLLQLIDYTGMGIKGFSEHIGISTSTTSTILRKDSCNLGFLYKVSKKIEWLNIRWFITGDGKMIVKSQNTNILPLQVAENQAKYKIKLSKKLSKNGKKNKTK